MKNFALNNQSIKSILVSLLAIQVISLPTYVFAAKPKTLGVEAALLLPMPDRLAQLTRQGSSTRAQLEKLAFDKKASLQTRWRALTAVGRLYPHHNQEFLEKAMKSREWFMRNAALIVAPYGNRQWAVKWSRILMHDPALVVRTAAVQSLRQLGAVEAQGLLWEKLYSSENYHAGDSLWIRRNILEALEQFAKRGDESKFIRVLSDSDKSLHPVAVRSLEKLSGQKFATSTDWQNWWSRRSIQ